MEIDLSGFEAGFRELVRLRKENSDPKEVMDYANVLKLATRMKLAEEPQPQGQPQSVKQLANEITMATMFAAYLKLRDSGLFDEKKVAAVCMSLTCRVIEGSLTIDKDGVGIPHQDTVRKILEIVDQYIPQPSIVSNPDGTFDVQEKTMKGIDLSLGPNVLTGTQIQEMLNKQNSISVYEKFCLTDETFTKSKSALIPIKNANKTTTP